MRIIRHHGESSERGGTLALVLVVVLTIAALSAGLLQLGSTVTRRQASTVNRKLAFYMAEAGLAEAYRGLLIGKTGNVGTAEEPAVFGDGLFWVEATGNEDGTVTLDATGMVGNGRALLSMVVEPGEESPASLGFFGDADLDVPPGSLVDGYDSDSGPYVPPRITLVAPESPTLTGLGDALEASIESTLPGGGRLGANGEVTVNGSLLQPTVIDGDVTPGPGFGVQPSGPVLITGSSDPAPAAVPLRPPAVPSVPLRSGLVHSSQARS